MRLAIERMTYGACGLAHVEDGRVAFVTGGVVGDVVEAVITSENSSHVRATATEVLEPSPSRVEPPCPLVGICGGCPWGALARQEQLAAKQENLVSALERIGRFSSERVRELVKPIRSTPQAWGYRNKIEMTPIIEGGRMRLGLHGCDPTQIVSVKTCPLFEKSFASAPRSIAGALSYLGNSRDLSLERVGIRASRRTRALEIALWTPTGGFPRAQTVRVLSDAVEATGVVRVMCKGERRARRVSAQETLHGRGSWTERLGPQELSVSAPSFFQVNTIGAEILIDLALTALSPSSDEIAIDLYSGAGTFTLPLASRCAGVAAVESFGPAVRDLRRNLERARADNVEVIGGDAVREFPDQDADVLLVDPPRAGLAAEAITLIGQTSARDVAYVSCDPATLARDLARFERDGVFRPVAVTAVDLFPQTFHCEAVAHLSRCS
ncbi:23S rRNA m(5)U-1939 methyltransferase [Coriobacterium glomerans PW2]|uniref:23S rRNA m(5)U-1939 methyltransferase n=1 Tax=Coriobacterium glomerans (strain ATCC 49209 / DSM 20642 / JCM 10262 / PW2) TaxID=700015 RepID=F2NBQ1_CORGP|nr:23S rRNA (uracil(1939)-C(5))-methyltransferase RlmD [Coriobacterium glomerans]AEB06860.1 23S rRNA m(5)U-1939 methyltransferase [Coriobacterium glomerans PW2]